MLLLGIYNIHGLRAAFDHRQLDSFDDFFGELFDDIHFSRLEVADDEIVDDCLALRLFDLAGRRMRRDAYADARKRLGLYGTHDALDAPVPARAAVEHHLELADRQIELVVD